MLGFILAVLAGGGFLAVDYVLLRRRIAARNAQVAAEVAAFLAALEKDEDRSVAK